MKKPIDNAALVRELYKLHMRQIAASGGSASQKKRTPEERRKIASDGGKARWKKWKLAKELEKEQLGNETA